MPKEISRSITKYLQKRAVIRTLSGFFDRDILFRRAVVIPSLAESETLPSTLLSLYKNEPNIILKDTLILVIVNNRALNSSTQEDDGQLKLQIKDNEATLRWLANHIPPKPVQLAWIDASSRGNELPPWGGVGLARKIGCDSILDFLFGKGALLLPEEFVFFSLDADTLVSIDYLDFSSRQLLKSGKPGGILSFKHQLSNSSEGQSAIETYESFLNHYVDGLRLAGSPYAFHTVGSCICFTAKGYVMAGGFPARRLAGEDFYFCVDLAKLGQLCEISKTMVFPSARVSYRTPYGTGRRVAEIIAHGKGSLRCYDMRAFIALQNLLDAVSKNHETDADYILNSLHLKEVVKFLENRDFRRIWNQFRKQYRTKDSLLSAFHRWFDGFVTLKFIRYMDNVLNRLPSSVIGLDVPSVESQKQNQSW